VSRPSKASRIRDRPASLPRGAAPDAVNASPIASFEADSTPLGEELEERLPGVVAAGTQRRSAAAPAQRQHGLEQIVWSRNAGHGAIRPRQPRTSSVDAPRPSENVVARS